MRFPGPEFCLENNLFMIVGSIPAKAKKNLEVYFMANGTDEAFHLREGFQIINLNKSRQLTFDKLCSCSSVLFCSA